MPTQDGTGTMIGNTGNGFAKLTILSSSNNNYLNNLNIDKGILSPSFDKEHNDYSVTLNKYNKSITLTGEVEDEKSNVIGLGV